jgi:LysR family transcriptional regulator, hydrogen peroxide-inducible genes activator
MEISQLKYFLKVAEVGHFTRAANELALSQPALSRSIIKLEEELGQPLLERLGRSVVLTEAGEVLRQRAEQICGLVDDVKARITDDGESGLIRVASIPTIAPYLLPQLFRSFTRKYPAASLRMTEDTTERIVKQCGRGEVDVVVLALPAPTPHLDCEPLYEEELMLVMPSDHALAEKKRIVATDLALEPFVLLGEGHCLAHQIESFCARKRLQGVSVEKTSQLLTVQELVALGHGISFIPAMAAKLDQDPRRAYRSLTGESPLRTIATATNPYRFQSKLQRRFVDHLKEFSRLKE